MDSQVIIETIQRDVKDKTLLVRFYNLHKGTDLWIDGLSWRLYDFDMLDYLREEFGIDFSGCKTFMFDIMDADDAFIQRTCFHNGVFSQTTYDNINEALVDLSEEAIEAGIAMGIPVDKLNEDCYKGKWSCFSAFVEQEFKELSIDEIPEQYRKYIDYEKVAEDWEQQYYFCDGHVFDATYC